ncbi:Protein of unknown function [Pyronema omphalodes CBS 100304]|uniref:Uncharacterized protein n=1 Tax=Pyronema omphalodes (strain CBS 100304) TaxID=1076935 RepID=U4LQ90_PYROM|nr:Protein of unknown function [Pyronema omphalodes CBS 100304]
MLTSLKYPENPPVAGAHKAGRRDAAATEKPLSISGAISLSPLSLSLQETKGKKLAAPPLARRPFLVAVWWIPGGVSLFRTMSSTAEKQLPSSHSQEPLIWFPNPSGDGFDMMLCGLRGLPGLCSTRSGSAGNEILF